MHNSIKKFTKITLATAAILSLAPLNVSALSQDETVYAKLHSDGSLNYISVTEHLQDTANIPEITTNTILKNIENLNGFEGFTLNGKNLIWNAKGKDIYYSGNTEQKLPVELKVTYKLNGTEKPLDQILGQSGKAEIILEYHNLSKINDLYTPFVAAVTTVFPESTTHHLTITNGKVTSNGRNLAIAAVAAPGLYDSLKLDELKNLDIIHISYDTDNFELPDIYSAITPKVLDNEDLKAFDKLEDLYQDTDKLSQGSRDLVNGTNTLYNGIAELRQAVLYASQKLQTTGSVMTEDLLDQISTTASNTARSKVAEQKSTIRAQIHQQITSLPELSQLNNLKATLTAAAGDIVKAQVTAKMQEYAAANPVIYQDAMTVAQVPTADLPTFCAANAEKCAHAETFKQYQAAVTTQITQQVAGQFNININLNNIEDKLFQSVYSSMLSTAESTAALTARNVAAQVAESVQSGMTEQILTMLDTMIAGIDQLVSGAGELRTGMQQFDRDGIQTLNNFVNNKLRNTSDKLQRLTKLADEYKSYAGLAEGAEGETKFILMIEAQKK